MDNRKALKFRNKSCLLFLSKGVKGTRKGHGHPKYQSKVAWTGQTYCPLPQHILPADRQDSPRRRPAPHRGSAPRPWLCCRCWAGGSRGRCAEGRPAGPVCRLSLGTGERADLAPSTLSPNTPTPRAIPTGPVSAPTSTRCCSEGERGLSKYPGCHHPQRLCWGPCLWRKVTVPWARAKGCLLRGTRSAQLWAHCKHLIKGESF